MTVDETINLIDALNENDISLTSKQMLKACFKEAREMYLKYVQMDIKIPDFFAIYHLGQSHNYAETLTKLGIVVETKECFETSSTQEQLKKMFPTTFTPRISQYKTRILFPSNLLFAMPDEICFNLLDKKNPFLQDSKNFLFKPLNRQ